MGRGGRKGGKRRGVFFIDRAIKPCWWIPIHWLKFLHSEKEKKRKEKKQKKKSKKKSRRRRVGKNKFVDRKHDAHRYKLKILYGFYIQNGPFKLEGVSGRRKNAEKSQRRKEFLV